MKPRILRFVALLLLLLTILITITTIFLLAKPNNAKPTLTLIADSITDASTGDPIQADVYLNHTLTFQSVPHFQVVVPLDGSTEIRVVAPGYHAWGLRPEGGGSDKVLQGPVKLKPE